MYYIILTHTSGGETLRSHRASRTFEGGELYVPLIAGVYPLPVISVITRIRRCGLCSTFSNPGGQIPQSSSLVPMYHPPIHIPAIALAKHASRCEFCDQLCVQRHKDHLWAVVPLVYNTGTELLSHQYLTGMVSCPPYGHPLVL